MTLAIFDLDNTLLGGDSDYLWGQFLVEQGLVDGEAYERENQRFYDDYEAGTLDIYEYQAFMLRPLTEYPLTEMLAWREQFIAEKIQPILLPRAVDLLERHRTAGDTLLIVTATNRFITAPIAERFDVPHLLATEPEFTESRFTGRLIGIPCFQHGKVERLDQWLAETGYDSAFGARPLRRALQKYLESPLSLSLLSGEFPRDAHIIADVNEAREGLIFSTAQQPVNIKVPQETAG